MAKRKMGSIDYTPIIILGGLAAIGYYVYTQIGTGGGESKQVKDATAAALAKTLAKIQAAGDKQVTSDAELADIATALLQVAQDTGSGLSQSDMDSVVTEIEKVQSLSDLLIVATDFGFPNLGTTSNWTLCGWFGISCQAVSLSNFVKLFLDTDHLNQLNAWLINNNINYQF